MTNQHGSDLLAVRGLTHEFARTGVAARLHRRGRIRALDAVSLRIAPGETLGVVGESGCGKTTLGRIAAGLLTPTAGRVILRDRDVGQLLARDEMEFRRTVQIVFQDPYGSLNPRQTAGAIIGSPIRLHERLRGAALQDKVMELLELVGLGREHYNRFPHEFSGGQRQRIGIARAIAVNPALVICDEPVSALDVSIQAQIINLLEQLQSTLGISYLFIAHDLAVVNHICDRVMVMYMGQVMEMADRDRLYAEPAHPYTRALIDAVPVPDHRVERARTRRPLEGDVPSPSTAVSGCVFRSRCPLYPTLGVTEQLRCENERPPVPTGEEERFVSCHFPLDGGHRDTPRLPKND